MNNKRGVSGVIMAIVIIAVSIVVLLIVALVIMNLINRGSSQVVLDRFTVNVGIVAASVNYQTGIATMRIKREIGAGNLVGLKFIFEDKKSAEVFERRFVGFDELEEKTFEINLTGNNSSLTLFDVESVSVAPIILLENGEEIIGKIADTVNGLNSGNLGTGGIDPDEVVEICYDNPDCGTDHEVGDRYCSGLDIYQYWRIYTCDNSFCRDDMNPVYIDTCEFNCLGGICRSQELLCTNDTIVEDCGVNGYVSLPSCSQTGEQVVQEYRIYTCPNGVCSSEIQQQVIEVCEEEEVCNKGECFIPVECVEHIECDPGYVCELGNCEPETSLNQGTIESIWPFGIGEYFDSPNLEDPETASYTGKYITFDTGLETNCLRILQHLWPAKPEGYPYIKLNKSETNISSGDNYSIYITNYFC